MISLEMKNYSTIVIETQQKYQNYNQVKLINMNTLQVKKYYLLIKVKWQKQAKTIEDYFQKKYFK